MEVRTLYRHVLGYRAALARHGRARGRIHRRSLDLAPIHLNPRDWSAHRSAIFPTFWALIESLGGWGSDSPLLLLCAMAPWKLTWQTPQDRPRGPPKDLCEPGCLRLRNPPRSELAFLPHDHAGCRPRSIASPPAIIWSSSEAASIGRRHLSRLSRSLILSWLVTGPNCQCLEQCPEYQ